MSDTQQFTFTLEQQDDFAFLIRFDQDIPPLLADEPAPLGKGAGPNPSRLLAAGIANCLSASLLFALRKFKNNPGPITTVVTAHMERNEEKRLRVGRVDVMIQVDSPADSLEHLDRVLDQFEDFCVVTQSVRSGFPVSVTVRDGSGRVIKG
ncbi:MAG: OsmC family protein [Sulfuritalea sp.]|nr:OsmC family protein [Sulfuritalea sp.]